MTIDDLIEKIENELSIRRVGLHEWIIGKCRIECRISSLKKEIDETEQYLFYLKEAKARGEK